MRFGPLETDETVVIVAEAGNNHEGDLGKARELVHAASEAGVDAIKFQTFKTELFVSPGERDRFRRFSSFELELGEWEELAQLSEELGLVFFSSPLDLESAAFLNGIQPVFKIASGDNQFWPLIQMVASFRKPTVISTGLLGLESIRLLHQRWKQIGGSSPLALLHCVARYPVARSDATLSRIREIQTEIPGAVIGYSDHTSTPDAAVLSVAAGARIVEKHFTLDKNQSEYRDHQLSADPEEMSRIVEGVREAEALMGFGHIATGDASEEEARVFRRSLAAAKALQPGDRVSRGDIVWLRPGGGFTPGDEESVIGSRLARRKEKGELFMPADFLIVD